MSRFSVLTRSYLEKAGWYEGRKMSLVQYVKYRSCLLTEGYSWFPAVADFLEEFGDLVVKYSHHEYESIIRLDACYASKSFDTRWVTEDYASRISKTQLCAIGVESGHMLLFMNNAGNVYGGFDDFLCLVGISGTDAIEALCTNQQLPEIPERRS